MTKNYSKYLKSDSDGYIQITPEVKALAEKITLGAESDEEKVGLIHDYIKEIDYSINPSTSIDDLINSESLDCGSKHILQAALYRSLDIPTRIPILECPISGVEKAIQNLKIPKWASMATKLFFSSLKNNVKSVTHYAVEPRYNDEWHFFDATMGNHMCDFFDGEKKELCLSNEGTSGIMGCKRIGHLDDFPGSGVIFSSIIKGLLDLTGKANKIFDFTKNFIDDTTDRNLGL